MLEALFSERMGRQLGESAFQVLEKAQRLESVGKKIIHFEIGEPDFNTPANIVEAAKKALDEGYTHYTLPNGIPELRYEIVKYIREYKGITAEPEEVVVVPGAKPVIFYTIMSLVNPGDEVICQNPGFTAYLSNIRFAGGIPVSLPVREENDFRIDTNELRNLITNKTKLIILNSPANPTGSMLTLEDVKEIADIVRDRNIMILSDEIYDQIVYEGNAVSIASMLGMKEYTVILDGFSKAFAMTGWRIGFGVMNKELAESWKPFISNSVSCSAAFVQRACLEALAGSQEKKQEMIKQFKQRRDIIVDGLNSIKGVSCNKPAGAFYVFPNIKRFGMSSREMSDFLLNEAHVATLPGSAYGNMGEGYLRISFANSIPNIYTALENIEKALTRQLRA